MYILYIIFRKLSSFLLLLDGGPGRLCSVVVRLKGVYSAIELQAHTGLSGESRPHGLVVPGHALYPTELLRHVIIDERPTYLFTARWCPYGSSGKALLTLHASTKKRDTTLNRGSRYSRVVPIMVGQGGADPPTPEGNGFTVHRSCRFATDPYKIRELVKTVSPREGFSMIPRRRNDSNARELLHPSLFSRQNSSAT